MTQESDLNHSVCPQCGADYHEPEAECKRCATNDTPAAEDRLSWVVISKGNPETSNLFRAVLQARGISCYLQGDNTATILRHHFGLHKTRLLVQEDRANDALTVLREPEQNKVDD